MNNNVLHELIKETDNTLAIYCKWFQENKNGKTILPLLEIFLPKATENEWVEINIEDTWYAFNIWVSEYTSDIDIYIFFNLETETYSIGVNLINYKHNIEKINLRDFLNITQNRIKEIKAIIKKPGKEKEIINIHEFQYNWQLIVYHNFSNQEEDIVRNLSNSAWIAIKLRFKTIEDLMALKKYKKWNDLSKLEKCIQELKNCLIKSPNEIEEIYHKIIEKNPMIFNVYAKYFISKPLWFKTKTRTDKSSFVPDFLLQLYDESVLLIEIERANKKLSKLDGWQTAKFTQAMEQIQNREYELSDNSNLVLELSEKYPWIKHRRKYLLVLWRDSEFIDDIEKTSFINEKLSSMQKNIEILTYDDLVRKCETAITNIKNNMAL